MSIYTQNYDQIYINRSGSASNNNNKPGLFLFRSGSIRNHATAVSASVPSIIAITCSANINNKLTKLTTLNAYGIITVTSGSNTSKGDTRLILRYVSSSFTIDPDTGETTTEREIATDDKLLFTSSIYSHDYVVDIPILNNDDAYAVAFKTVNALTNNGGYNSVFSSSIVDDGSGINLSSSLGENMTIGSTFRIRSSSAEGTTEGKFLVYSIASSSVVLPDFDGTKVQIGGMEIGDNFQVGGGDPVFSYNIVQSGSGEVNQPFYPGDHFLNPSYSIAIVLDPNDRQSAYITGSNSSASLYFSGSGQMGIGTTTPTNAFDIKVDSFKIRSKDGLQELEFNNGRLITKKYANEEGTEASGSEIVLTYTSGAFGDEVLPGIKDQLGQIIWQTESGSFIGQYSEGIAAKIHSEVVDVNEGGIQGNLIFSFPDAPETLPAERMRIQHVASQPAVTITGSNDGGVAALEVTQSFASSLGNLAARFLGDTQITGSLGITGDINASTFITTTISSSIIYASGSNIFGDELSDIHQFTGSVNITGSFNATINGGSF